MAKSYMLYRMIILPMTSGTPNPLNRPNLYIFVLFLVFLLCEQKDFKFGMQADRS